MIRQFRTLARNWRLYFQLKQPQLCSTVGFVRIQHPCLACGASLESSRHWAFYVVKVPCISTCLRLHFHLDIRLDDCRGPSEDNAFTLISPPCATIASALMHHTYHEDRRKPRTPRTSIRARPGWCECWIQFQSRLFVRSMHGQVYLDPGVLPTDRPL